MLDANFQKETLSCHSDFLKICHYTVHIIIRTRKVMDGSFKYLYCFECSLQFDKKYVLDVHLSVVHGEMLDIKQETDLCFGYP